MIKRWLANLEDSNLEQSKERCVSDYAKQINGKGDVYCSEICGPANLPHLDTHLEACMKSFLFTALSPDESTLGRQSIAPLFSSCGG